MDGISFSFAAGVGGIDFEPISTPPAKKEPTKPIPIPPPKYHPADAYNSSYSNSPEALAADAALVAAEVAYYAAHPELKRPSPSYTVNPSLMDEIRHAFGVAYPKLK